MKATHKSSNIRLELENIGKTFVNEDGKSTAALTNINLKINENKIVTIVGPSGCGKTTLLEIIAGLSKPTTGYVKINNQNAFGNSSSQPKPNIGMVFQEYTLFPWRTVLKNVEFGLEIRGVDKKTRKEKAEKYIDMVGLSDFTNKYPKELSGGMKQRIAIARALAYEPDIILMDEPFSAVDPLTRHELQNQVLKIQHETKKTIIFVTHWVGEAIYLADKLVVLTERPGTIKKIIDITFEKPHFKSNFFYSKVFDDIRKDVWKLMGVVDGRQ